MKLTLITLLLITMISTSACFLTGPTDNPTEPTQTPPPAATDDGDAMEEKGAMIEEEDDSMEEGAMEEKADDQGAMEDKDSMNDGAMEDEGSMEGETMEEKGSMEESMSAKHNMINEFSQEAYDQAIAEGKDVFLYFYADWCSSCQKEFPATQEFFEENENENLVGFRVHYKDGKDTEAMQALAREYGVSKQHTKFLVQNGEQTWVNKELWNTQDYSRELAN